MSETRTPQTTAEDAVRLLDLLAAESVETWVAGGWGVDALVGHQTRPHRDLDLLIPLPKTLTAHRVLLAGGYVMESDWYPVRFEMIHPAGRAVDVHPIRMEGDGGGRLELENGDWWRFDAEALSGRGTIGDRACRCLSVAAQIRSHTGYEPTDKDTSDMKVLATRFDVQLPSSYARATGGTAAPSAPLRPE